MFHHESLDMLQCWTVETSRLNFVRISVHLSQHPAPSRTFGGSVKQWGNIGKLSNVFQVCKIAPTTECQNPLQLSSHHHGKLPYMIFYVTSVLDLAWV